MKIALISDTHYGCRNDHIAFLDNNKKFLDNLFFPLLESEKIDTIIHLGDLVDRRKYSNHYTISRLRRDFLDRLSNYDVYWILGNHDLFYKQSLKVNASSLVQDYQIVVINFPIEFNFDGLEMLFVPWICEENREECYEAINKSNAPICMGHFEFQGFDLGKGQIQQHGDSIEAFKKFSKVFSGHYHHKSNRDNIYYLGASAEFTWVDYSDPRGFHIFDTSDRTLDFIPNPYTMFQKVIYDDRDKATCQIPENGFEQLQGKFIKVIVRSQKRQEQFEWFMNKIEEQKPLSIQIIRDELITALNESNFEIENKDTLSVIMSMIESTKENINSDKLKGLFTDLYKEAQDVE